MKKLLKWVSISVLSLIFLVLFAVGMVIWFVFTPEKLTPIIRTQAAKYINCKSEIGQVELTFFSTFPSFGLKVNRFALINPIKNASNDTLISAHQLVGVIDVAAWWKRNEIVLNELQLSKGTVNAFVDSLGHTNFDIAKTDTVASVADTTKSSMPFRLINIRNVELENINISYIDQSQKRQAGVRNLTAQFSGSFVSDTINTHLNMSEGKISLNYAGENYLNEAAVKFNIPTQIILSQQLTKLSNAEASINNLSIALSGFIENNQGTKQIMTDLNYQIKSWPIPAILALIPPTYRSYLKEVTAVDGLISSEGKIKGAYSESSMPLMDIHLVLQDGTLKHAKFLIPLSHVNADGVFYSDLKNDALSYFLINRFSAETPLSAIKTSGKVTHLLSDIQCDLNSDADLVLSEFSPMIPANLKTTLKSRVSGQVKSFFSMSQVEKMLLDKMKISGSIAMTDFAVKYDSLSLKTDYTKVDFALPNPNVSSKNMRFVYAKINSKSLETSKLKGYNAYLENAAISLEASDVRDTTRIPDVACSFKLDSLSASMDTMKVAIQKPAGQFALLPQKGKKMEAEIKLDYNCGDLTTEMGSSHASMNTVKLIANILNDKLQPKIKLTYSGENLKMNMGSDSARMKKVELNANIVNDQKQKDIFLQWLVKGFLRVDQGVISMSSMKYPFEIPSIKMDFDPELFDIKESKLKIDNSDFKLSGTLRNVLSYIRKDSLLRGNFNFVSDNTDVTQLMQLTSGLGSDSVKSATTTETSSGPYMVPKGIDMLLNVNIGAANFGAGSASGIKGDLRVKDGLLLLDGFDFTTPAAKMQLTAMYRTPRKNHLYMGFDYHMTDVEIAALLNMFPDIDTIMPMLRSFGGKGEFHMAAETYLDSLYNPKKSTIRGSASIKGQDLVLMDGETFSEIAKTLKFRKKTVNRVDSLSAEFTVFKQEIDVYPFLMVMDKYKAVIAGRHNMDLSFNYHISVVDSPLPLKFGIQVKGTMDNMKYSPAKCEYPELYRPASRHIVQNKQLEFRQMIRDALTQRLKRSKSGF